MKTLFSKAELIEELSRVAVKGFTLRFREERVVRAGPDVVNGTWVAQVSRDGHYIKAQHKDPVKAVARLAERIDQAKRGGLRHCWRPWRRRPWKPGER